MASLRRHVTVAGRSERRRLVSFCDERVVESAFGGDGAGGVVPAGIPAPWHHHAPVASGLDFGWVAGPQRASWLAQFGEQVSAARIGRVRVARR
jgi:hypothetical protein